VSLAHYCELIQDEHESQPFWFLTVAEVAQVFDQDRGYDDLP
jgi:hypothetical protein